MFRLLLQTYIYSYGNIPRIVGHLLVEDALSYTWMNSLYFFIFNRQNNIEVSLFTLRSIEY